MLGSSADGPQFGPPRSKRLRVDAACDLCRKKKVKCDGVRPVCGSCQKNTKPQYTCIYAPKATGRSVTGSSLRADQETSEQTSLAPGSVLLRQRPNTERPLQPRPPTHLKSFPLAVLAPSTQPRSSLATPVNSDASSFAAAVVEDGATSPEYFGSSSTGSFTGQIKAALDAKYGQSIPPKRSAVPMLNASLFAPLQVKSASDPQTDDVEYLLPSRKQADQLIEAYWFYADPLYPVLDKLRFDLSYRAVFDGTFAAGTERIFVSTLNIIFALSTQLLESKQPEQREASSSAYFRRAQDLVGFDIWDAASIELVQYLLLMCQYLQCTNNPHRIWMAVGSAIRIAQGLGLHNPEASRLASNFGERRVRQRVWQGCIVMDRMVSVTHGRPAMISQALASIALVPEPYRPPRRHDPEAQEDSEGEDCQPHGDFVTKNLELFEMINRIMLSLYDPTAARVDSAGKIGVVHPRSNEEQLGMTVELDACLSKWHHSLPVHLRLGSSDDAPDGIRQRQAVVLYLRFLHARILLFRPMLARFCLDQSPEGPDQLREASLGDHMAQQSAVFCVDTAKKMISIILQFQRYDGHIGVLPSWWYRVFYIYTAATIFTAATLRPGVFPSIETIQCWDQAMSMLNAHEKLSRSVQSCAAALRSLFSKIQEAQDVAAGGLGRDGGLVEAPDLINGSFHEAFQEVGFGVDFALGAEEMPWL